jgi:hypothetical protein
VYAAAFFNGASAARRLLSVEDKTKVSVRHMETHPHMKETHEHGHGPSARVSHVSQLHQAQRQHVPVQDVAVRFHVMVPEGVDRQALISELTASLQKNVVQELAHRGVPTHHVSINGVKHVPAHLAGAKQQLHGIFARWAKKYLLDGLGQPGTGARALARSTELAEMNEESAGHKASGLERLVSDHAVSVFCEHAFPFLNSL